MRKPLLAALCLLLTGFTEEGPVLPLPNKILPVPLVRQRTDFSCGDVAVLAILRYYDPAKWNRVGEKKLYEPLKTTSKAGTDPMPMAAFMTKNGLPAEVRTITPTLKDLERSIDAGRPVIVAIQAWQDKPRVADFKPWKTDWDDGHYVVVVGYDSKNFYFMDPSTGGKYTYIERNQFAERWHDVLGKRNVRTQRIGIFLKTDRKGVAPARALPNKVMRIN